MTKDEKFVVKLGRLIFRTFVKEKKFKSERKVSKNSNSNGKI